MTPDERAHKIAVDIEEQDYGRFATTQAIAAAIRDAVDEAEATTKQAIDQRDEANHQRNMAEHKAGQNWEMYLNASRSITAYREERDKFGLGRHQARAALEPFARLAKILGTAKSRDALVALRPVSPEIDGYITSAQLRVAREAWLALGRDAALPTTSGDAASPDAKIRALVDAARKWRAVSEAMIGIDTGSVAYTIALRDERLAIHTLIAAVDAISQTEAGTE